MRMSLIRGVAFAVLLAFPLPAAGAGEDAGQKGRPPDGGAAPQPPDPEATPELRARIDALIRDLASERFEVRTEAKKGLVIIGRPALGALRAASSHKDQEVADAARKLIAEIEGGKARTTVKVKSSGSRQAGTYEISVISSVDTVTVRDFKDAFGVEIKSAEGKVTLLSEPTRAEFARKHPEVWTRYAEPILDEANPDRAVKEAMVREVMPQVVRQFVKVRGTEPKPEELAELEKMVREKLDKAFEKRTTVPADPGRPPAGEEKKPPESPRRGPSSGPELKPLD